MTSKRAICASIRTKGILFLAVGALLFATLPAKAAEVSAPAPHVHQETPAPANPAPLIPAPWSKGAVPGQASSTQGSQAEQNASMPQGSGITEHLGQTIPAGIILRDEEGREVDLQKLITKPAIIAPVFFSCTSACNILLSNLSAILPQTGPKSGQDYITLAVSFDETETPGLAKMKKNDYITATRGAVAPEDWLFLTGNAENVKKFLDSVGFAITRTPQGFAHPVALIIAAPGGKIVRYLYGQTFMPFDLSMAVNEAAEGKVGLSIHRVISYCFAYDPEGRRYVFNFMRVAGGIIVFGLLVFFIILVSGKNGHVRRP